MKKTYNLSREALKSKCIKSATVKTTGVTPEKRTADKIAAVLRNIVF